MTVLPTFLVIGAGKAGTTTLHFLLDQVPDIWMSEPKEIQYFSHPVHPDHPLDWYGTFFRDGADHAHRGESSVTYTMFPTIPGVPERIHQMNPATRLVYLVRDPVRRMVSAYAQSRHLGYERRPIEEALRSDMAYIGPSLYWTQLREYLRFFPANQIHVETHDDLAADPQSLVERIGSFLAVDVPAIDTSLRMNERQALRATRPGYARALRILRERGRAEEAWQQRLHQSRVGSRPFRPGELDVGGRLVADLARLFSDELAHLEDFIGRPLPPWSRGSRPAGDSS